MLKSRDSYISKEYIFTKITQQQVFEKYLGISISSLLDGTLFCNPLRDDTIPTCTFKVYVNSKSYPEGYFINFRDWADNRGYDAIGLVQKIANNCSYMDALCLIAHHFNLLSAEDELEFQYVLNTDRMREVVKMSQKEVNLRITRKPFEKQHIEFWKQYHLDIEDLEDDVFAISCFWLNNERHNPARNLGFAYHFGDYNYKVYNPLAKKQLGQIKFMHNNARILQGENKLKFDKDLLILTSSYKDVKLLRKIDKLYDMNFECAATMSETTKPIKESIDFFKTKYRNILLYYNNDDAGLKAAKSQSEEFGLEYIVNPENLPKDITDISKELGFDFAVETINNLLYV